MEPHRIQISSKHCRNVAVKCTLIGICVVGFVSFNMPEPLPLKAQILSMITSLLIGSAALAVAYKINKNQYIELNEDTVVLSFTTGKQILYLTEECKPEVSESGKYWLIGWSQSVPKKLSKDAFPNLKHEIESWYRAQNV